MPLNFESLQYEEESGNSILTFEGEPDDLLPSGKPAYAFIIQGNDEVKIQESQSGYDVYTFVKSNIKILFTTLPPPNVIYIDTDTTQIYDRYSEESKEQFVEAIQKYILSQKGRNTLMVHELGESRQLPENVDSVIASFLSGKKGSLQGQLNKLKQNTGISLAPRAGGRRARKTRKTRKQA